MSNNCELNREQLLDELSNFEKKKLNGDIPDILNKYLQSISENGDTIFEWNKLQTLLRRKLELVMNEFNSKCPTDHIIQLPNVKPFDFNELKTQILEAIDAFPSAPFTIQRLCELITNPSKHYKRTDKFMRGLEKNILVVSTIQPKSAQTESSHYSTSSFKNLFSTHHSSVISSQSSPSSSSTSLLVNGIADVVSENQMNINSTDEDMTPEPKPSLKSSPVSPTSIPLCPTTSSPPSQHLPPLQQLDSFTTVFASSPSTPLSVVTDIHSYEQTSSSLVVSSTPCPKSPKDNISYITTNDSKDTQNVDIFESSTVNSQNDSQVITSSSNTSLVITSEIDNKDVKEEQNLAKKLLIDSNVTQALDISQTQTEIQINKEFNKKVNEENNENTESNQNINNNNNNDDNNDDNNSSNSNIDDENSFETNNNNIIEKKDNSIKIENISSDITTSVELDEENKPLIENPSNVTQNQNEMIESNNNSINENNSEIVSRTDEDMIIPMDYCGSNNNSSLNNDFNDKTTELIPDCNIMDDTLSQSEQSDQSEPMDED